LELGSILINQTIRNANANANTNTNPKQFHCLRLEVNNQGWSLHKVGSTYSVSFSLLRGRGHRVPLTIHQSKHAAILDSLLEQKVEKGSLKLWRSKRGRWYALLSV